MKDCFIEKISQTRGRYYYVNIESGISQWAIPPDSILPFGWELHSSTDGNVYYTNVSSRHTQWKKPEQKDAIPCPIGWEYRLTPKCNTVYYINSKTNKTQWILPIKEVNESSKLVKKKEERRFGQEKASREDTHQALLDQALLDSWGRSNYQQEMQHHMNPLPYEDHVKKEKELKKRRLSREKVKRR